ncbi:LolA family protein [Erwinia oleae]|uniref:LolA family protein n=1 Tax=Erwinia oleae TaxID=796334 RepID=UPI00054DC825|nr:outer membrane lipoprotein carrier protein LolA [Erwinia oleae]
MFRVVFAALLLFSAAAPAVTLEALQQRFAGQPVVRANFSQIREINGMTQPLKSSGELLIARDNGLWWHQAKPFPMTLVLDDTRMVQVMNGQTPQIVTKESNPQMFQFNHLLRALFQADREVLEQNFRLDFQDEGQEKWRLALTPKTSPLDKLFTSLTLTGATWLETIQLRDRQGDNTLILLSNQRATPETLTDEERQRFVF